MRLLTQKWLGRSLLGLVAAVTVLAAAVPATASATASHTSQVVGHVYVDDNTTGVNTIAAFDRHADGSLTAQPGSPFIAGGQGTGSGLASQGAIQLSANRRFVIAVDPGSNEISVLRIERDGALRLVPNGVVPSGGAMPVSVAVHGDVVYVANAGPGRHELQRIPAERLGRPAPDSGCDDRPAVGRATGRRACSTPTEPGSWARASAPHRSTASRSTLRDAPRGPRLPVPGAGSRPVRERVPPDRA